MPREGPSGLWIPGRGRGAELRYRDPTRMGKVYGPPATTGVPRRRSEWVPTPTIPRSPWKSGARVSGAEPSGRLKNLLRNQELVAGIGNAYSDEILHAARLLPTRKRGTLAPEEVDELYEAPRSTLSGAIAVLRERVPPHFETEVRDFLAVHGKGGQPCPRCGNRITQVEAGGFVTSYCRHCQR